MVTPAPPKSPNSKAWSRSFHSTATDCDAFAIPRSPRRGLSAEDSRRGGFREEGIRRLPPNRRRLEENVSRGRRCPSPSPWGCAGVAVTVHSIRRPTLGQRLFEHDDGS